MPNDADRYEADLVPCCDCGEADCPECSECPACHARGHEWLCPTCAAQVERDLAEIDLERARRLVA